MPRSLRRPLILNGDGTDVELLQAEDIGRSDVVVSVVDSDERNLLTSLLARELGVRRVIARVTRPANLRLFERMGVDVALSARGAAIAAIAHHIEGGPWSLLAVLEEGQARVIEVQVPAGYPPTVLQRSTCCAARSSARCCATTPSSSRAAATRSAAETACWW